MADRELGPGELPGDEADDVLFGSTYGVRTMELNRPKKLNSLNGSMARKMIARLQVQTPSSLPTALYSRALMASYGDATPC